MPLLSFQCSLKCIFVCVSSLMKRCALTVSLFEIVSVYVRASWSVSWSQQHHSQSCIRPPGEHLPPTPPTLSCSKQPHITPGLCCFPLLLLSAHKLVTKAENTEMAGRQHKFQKNTPRLNERHFCSFLKSLRHLLSWTAKVMLKTMQFEVSFVVCLLKT